MKRLTSLLLAVLLLLVNLTVLAAEYTLDEKLFKQVKDGSGLKVTLKTTKTGGRFTILNPEANTLVSTLLSGTELSLRYLRGVGTMKGQQETELLLLRNGQPLGDLRLIKDSLFEQLTSSFLGTSRYVDRRDGGALMALLTGQDPTWPPLEGVLLKLNTAESTWQGLVANKLDMYSTKLSLWLQGYTITATQRDAQNQLQTRVTVTVPVQQLIPQIKQLLLDMYSDAELLALLAQEMNAREVAAWLQPGMMNGFFQSLDQLPLTGSLVSERLLDAQGQIVENRLTLPMGGARGLSRILYAYTMKTTGAQTSLTLEYLPKNTQNTRGAVTALMFEGGQTAGTEEFSYMGTLSLQPEAASDAFTVDTAEGDVPASVYSFNLLYAPSEEVVDQAAGSSTRDFELMLRLTPQGDTTLTPQVIKANMSMQSRLNSRSATYFTGTLLWQDEGTRAQVQADISGNSAPPWTIAPIDPAGSVRVDSLNSAQLVNLSRQIQTVLLNALTSSILRLAVPTATP